MDFTEKLRNLARVALEVGVNLQPGQRLVLMGPVGATELMREITTQAYQLGCPYVHTTYVDDELMLSRALHADEDTLSEIDQFEIDATQARLERGDAYLRVGGADPDLMASADATRLAAISNATRRAIRPVGELVQRFYMPWTIVAYAHPAWAEKVFPGVPTGQAVAQLWDQIFAASRADQANPVEAWHEHVATLQRKSDLLNERQFHSLKITGPGTDLTLGLADNHHWLCAGTPSEKSGQHFVANIPTEEVFTAPHAMRVDGTVRATKPLSYQGQLIDGFSFTFKDGQVVAYEAEVGKEALTKMLEIDEGAKRCGEIALVPHHSPISQSGVLFYNTLFDENAACHIALGRAYATTVQGGAHMELAELQAHGFNDSLTHVDFMFGSDAIDIDGVNADGSLEPVMRNGEWV